MHIKFVFKKITVNCAGGRLNCLSFPSTENDFTKLSPCKEEMEENVGKKVNKNIVSFQIRRSVVDVSFLKRLICCDFFSQSKQICFCA